jgi:dienelactone hydrolase
MTIRAFFRATKVATAQPPYDTLTLKIFYPAAPTGSETERMTGVVAADATLAPFPVLIFLPGINVGPEAYQWLALALAAKGLVVVTYSWIAEEMPGYISLTPGVDLTAVTPTTYLTKPTCPAIQPILDELARLQENSVLAGLLDLNTIILGGHSAGGAMALQNCHPAWFPQVQGAFTYGAHTMASTLLGFAPGTILPLTGQRPLLILGGSADGVIAASGQRYGMAGSPTSALERTFAEAIGGGREDCFLVILEGANHFSCVHPIDKTAGRPFLDHPTTQPDDQIRAELITLIHFFIDGHIRRNPPSRIALKQQLNSGNPLIAKREIK